MRIGNAHFVDHKVVPNKHQKPGFSQQLNVEHLKSNDVQQSSQDGAVTQSYIASNKATISTQSQLYSRQYHMMQKQQSVVDRAMQSYNPTPSKSVYEDVISRIRELKK